MILQTKYVGKIVVNEVDVIHFPFGLPGFTDEHRFVLLDLSDTPIFQSLQSITTPSLAFIVTNPHLIYTDYEFKLDKNIQESLQISGKQDVRVLSIVTLKAPFDQSTLNLKAPIIINDKQKLGKQYILINEDYPTKALLKERNDARIK